MYALHFSKSWACVGTSRAKLENQVDLPTLLDDRSLSIDIGRYGRFIKIKINGFATVTVEDGIARDGVIQVVGDVLIPPKHVGGMEQEWQGQDMSEEELMERLEPYVE